jgi:membrane protein DedA with SNARE-associated domain
VKLQAVCSESDCFCVVLLCEAAGCLFRKWLFFCVVLLCEAAGCLFRKWLFFCVAVAMASTSSVVMMMMLVTCSLVILVSSAQFYASGRYGKRGDLSQRSELNLRQASWSFRPGVSDKDHFV